MSRRKTRLSSGLATLLFGFHASGTSGSSAEPPTSASAHALGGVPFTGSTIISMSTSFQPSLLYKKFPPDERVVPGQPWQLSFGAALESQASSISVTLRLDDPQQNPDVTILVDSANFVPADGLYNNFDPGQPFEIQYTGPLNPYLGPIDFVLEPDGFAEVPVRVDLNLIEQPAFPLPFFPQTASVAVVGNIVGDSDLEILVSGSFGSFGSPFGVHAFDSSGNALPGWPFLEATRTPVIANLDGDEWEEALVLAGQAGSVVLLAIEGSGSLRWQTAGDFEDFAVVAADDLDGDGEIDIVVPTSTNLMRLHADGSPAVGWAAEAPNDIHVTVPIIGDLDGDLSDGKEIVACGAVFGAGADDQVYVWNEDGTLASPMWPKELSTCVAPAVVDLDGNPSNGSEIVMAIDFVNDPPVDPKTGFLNTFTVFAWHGNGSDVAGWPHRFFRDPNAGFTDDRSPTSVSAADLDRDGDVEVVVSTYGQGDPANGNLFVFHHDGTLDPDWPQWAGIAQTPSPWGGVALADLDGDGFLEIVTGSFRGVFAFRANGQPFEGFPRLTSDNFAQPVIADLDADGTLEIVQPSLLGLLHAWQLLTPSFDPRPWPQFRQNAAHSGARETSNIPAASALSLAALAVALIAAGAILVRRNREPRARVPSFCRPQGPLSAWTTRFTSRLPIKPS